MEERKEISVSKDELRGSMIQISRSLLQQLYTLSNASSIRSILNHSSDTYELSLWSFEEILKDTLFSIDDLLSRSIPFSVGQKAMDKMSQDSLAYRKLRKSITNDNNFRTPESRNQFALAIIKELREGKTDLFYEAVAKMKSCHDDFKHIMKIMDFHFMEQDYFQNLSFFLDAKLVDDYKEAFKRAIFEFDIDALDRLFLEVQTKILNHWREFITDVHQFQNGKIFYFLGHSTSETQFHGEFWHRFVSCSLLTPQLTETFHNGFGFLFPPENIVAARGYDMYVNNEAESVEELIDAHSYWIQIDMPERVMEDTLSHSKNRYSEVVIDGFHPIALFCLSLGTKNLNYNYRSVHTLQKSFPDLPIVDIDLTYYQTDWLKMCLDVIAEIEYALTDHYGSFAKSYGRRFQKFWEEFQALKKNPDYKEQDILQIYLQNKELISRFLPWQELFSGKYDDKMIRYLLYYHKSYNIDAILSGDGKVNHIFSLIRMLEDYPDKKSLDAIVPDLGKFLTLTKKIPFKERTFYEYQKSSNKSFSLLVTLLLKEAKNQEPVTLETLEKYRNRKSELEKMQASDFIRGKISRQLIDQEAYYHLACASYKEEEKQLQKEEEKLALLKEGHVALEANILKEKENFYTLHQTTWIEFLKEIGTLFRKMNISDAHITKAETKVEECKSRLQDSKDTFLDAVGYSIEDYPEMLKKAKDYFNQNIEKEDDVFSLELASLSHIIEDLEQELNLYHHLEKQK